MLRSCYNTLISGSILSNFAVASRSCPVSSISLLDSGFGLYEAFRFSSSLSSELKVGFVQSANAKFKSVGFSLVFSLRPSTVHELVYYPDCLA